MLIHPLDRKGSIYCSAPDFIQYFCLELELFTVLYQIDEVRERPI